MGIVNESSAIDGVWNYAVTKGCAWTETGAWTDADGTPINITDAEISVVVKDAEDSSGQQIGTITATVVSGPAGTFSIGQTVAQVAAVGVGSWWWRATITLDGGEPRHLWHGLFEVADVVEV